MQIVYEIKVVSCNREAPEEVLGSCEVNLVSIKGIGDEMENSKGSGSKKGDICKISG